MEGPPIDERQQDSEAVAAFWKAVELRDRVRAFVFLPIAAFGTLFAGSATAFIVVFLFFVRLPTEPPAAGPDSITFDSPLSDRLFFLAIFAGLFVAFALWTTVLLRRVFQRKR